MSPPRVVESLPTDSPVSAGSTASRQPSGRVATHRERVWHEIWLHRELLRQFINRDVRLRYHQAVMGFLWALLMPCLVLGASLIVRTLMNSATTHAAPFAGTAFKAWAWAFFVGSINFATNSLLSNINLISKIYFPREVLPIAAVGAQAVDGAVGLAFLALLSPILGVQFTAALLWIPVLLLLLVLITVGLGLLLAATNIFYRDIKYLVQLAVTFGIFVTPVFYGLADVHGRTRLIVALNPLSSVLEGLQLAVEGKGLSHTIRSGVGVPVWSPWYLVGVAAVGVVLLFAAAQFFRARADQFAELA